MCVQSQTQFVYSHRHNLCTVTDTMCVQSQTQCVYSHRQNVCTVTDTICVQSQTQCVYSHRNNVCTVTDTMCVQSQTSQPHCPLSCATVQFAVPPCTFCWCSFLNVPNCQTAGTAAELTLPAFGLQGADSYCGVMVCALLCVQQLCGHFRSYIWDK